jgi:hypothetical protein
MDIIELKGAQNNYGKIESIHYCNDKLYVGTTGNIYNEIKI